MAINVTVGALSAHHVMSCLNLARGRHFQHDKSGQRRYWATLDALYMY